MPFSAKAVANEFLALGRRDGIPLSPMKLQKLVYFAHGWHLAVYGEPLLDERVEAWQYGPVIKSLYHEFKRFGNESITKDATSVKLVRDGRLSLRFVTPRLAGESDDVLRAKKVVARVWNNYCSFSAVQLSKMTHDTGSPWHKTWEPMADNPIKGTDIPNDEIKRFFREQASNRRQPSRAC
jgi:uncharacterized phage-associated protein